MSKLETDWYRDAKLGVIIHWGPYSVPAWAPTEHGGAANLLRDHDWAFYFRNNPYAEWYANGLRLRDSATRAYHDKHFGKHVVYERIAKRFKAELDQWKPAEWVDFFSEVGMKYVVMVAKHHDGFLMWPSSKNHGENFVAEKDVVGELADAAREKEMRFGVYYSGLLDWTVQAQPIGDFQDLLLVETDEAYADYAESHFEELIERYKPDLLWNDIGLPHQISKKKLIGRYKSTVSHGVVNDRWRQTGPVAGAALSSRAVQRKAAEKARESIVGGAPAGTEGDFATYESTAAPTLQAKPWELVKALGQSFGFNQAEEHYISGTELVQLLIDVVSKNGNLLVNVGPRADGTIPVEQRRAIAELGAWLAIHGEAIFNTRPWKRAEGQTSDGVPIRFTTTDNALYVIFLETPPMLRLAIEGLEPKSIPRPKLAKGQEDELVVSLLGSEREIEWSFNDSLFSANIPGSFRPTGPSVMKIAWQPVNEPTSNFYNDII